MKVRVTGGLANRLRAMLSRLELGERHFVWEPTEEIGCASFQEAFEPIRGVRIDPRGDFDESTGDPAWLPGSTFDAPRWRPFYALLRPAPSARLRIEQLQRAMPPGYRAMHVRRTDHVAYARAEGAFTPDAAFREFAARSYEPCYLATDNRATQEKFSGWLGHLVVNKPIKGGAEESASGDGRRFTSLLDAVVDLFVCAGAREFLGSGASSFSKAIEYMRAP